MKGGGGGVASREGGGHVGITICGKPPTKAALVIEAYECSEVAGTMPRVLTFANICKTTCVSRRGLFLK
jgi:hypothetical protein